MGNTKAVEDYLEAILMLEEKGQKPSITNIAQLLMVSKPAATQMTKELKAKGFISKDPYRELAMTPEGLAVAQGVYHRHKTLCAYLESIGVSPATAEDDCCQIEHVISEETFKAIEKELLYSKK
jgi:DtxR family Mn-dependent transcriptional regulator